MPLDPEGLHSHEFYKDDLDGELTISTFADFQGSQETAEENLVMHAQLE